MHLNNISSFSFCVNRSFRSSSLSMWRKTSRRISSSPTSGPWSSTLESDSTGARMASSCSAWTLAETPAAAVCVCPHPFSIKKKQRLMACVCLCLGVCVCALPFIVCARCFESASTLYRKVFVPFYAAQLIFSPHITNNSSASIL